MKEESTVAQNYVDCYQCKHRNYTNERLISLYDEKDCVYIFPENSDFPILSTYFLNFNEYIKFLDGTHCFYIFGRFEFSCAWRKHVVDQTVESYTSP